MQIATANRMRVRPILRQLFDRWPAAMVVLGVIHCVDRYADLAFCQRGLGRLLNGST
jgi:hypothetical protein